jgi:hypothetical protein
MPWPTIQKPSLSTQSTVKDNSLKSELINGQKISRARYTRQLREWQLKWAAMPDTDLVLLLTWFSTCAGGSASFTWSDEFGNNYTVRFLGDIDHSSVNASHSAVTLKLEEV